MDEALDRRLGAIERRLLEIEAKLGLTQPAPAEEAPATPPPLPMMEAEPLIVEAPSVWKVPPPPIPRIPTPPRTVQYQRPTLGTATQNESLEHVIGLKWAGWVGAIVLVIGAALGFKFAYDQGWLKLLSDGPKVGLLALCGIALLTAGEYVYRRINRVSAAGLYGAGVAVLFVASYAGHAWYGLFAQSTAMALMGASAVTGVLVAARAQLVSIAILAILGGNLAPAIIGGNVQSLVPFLTYLLLLQVLAVALCWWQATPKWWVLRGVSLAGTTIWMLYITGQVPQMSPNNWTVAIVYAGLFAAIYQAEVILTTMRVAKRSENETAEPVAGVIFSLVTTAALTLTLLLLIENHFTPYVRGAWVLSLAIAAALTGFALPTARVRMLSNIAIGFYTQALLLVVLAVPIAFDGAAVVFAWMLLAVGMSVLGAMTRRPAAHAGATVLWLLAAVAWGEWQRGFATQPVLLAYFDVVIETRLVVAAALVIAAHVIGLCIARTRIEDEAAAASDVHAGWVLHVAGALVWAIASMLSLGHAGASAAIAVYGLISLAVGFIPAMQFCRLIAAVTLLAAAWKLSTHDLLWPRFPMRGATPVLPVLDTTAALAILAAGLVFGLGFVRRIFAVDPFAVAWNVRTAMLASFPLLLIVIGSIEIDRYAMLQTSGPEWIVRQVGWSIFWAVMAVLCLVVGFVWRLTPVRVGSLALLAVTLIKVTIVDLSGAGTGWRILSFLGLGALLLGTSVLYGKFDKQLASRPDEREGAV